MLYLNALLTFLMHIIIIEGNYTECGYKDQHGSIWDLSLLHISNAASDNFYTLPNNANPQQTATFFINFCGNIMAIPPTGTCGQDVSQVCIQSNIDNTECIQYASRTRRTLTAGYVAYPDGKCFAIAGGETESFVDASNIMEYETVYNNNNNPQELIIRYNYGDYCNQAKNRRLTIHMRCNRAITEIELGTQVISASSNLCDNEIHIDSAFGCPVFNGTFTNTPTIHPTLHPIDNPSTSPSKHPTLNPSSSPSKQPTRHPTNYPTINPTTYPSTDPTTIPTQNPTQSPTNDPTSHPTHDPTKEPTTHPTINPTKNPSTNPTYDPTGNPSTDPTNDPTYDPTANPTFHPSYDPTTDPSMDPSTDPTKDPTHDPTNDPTSNPTTDPSTAPTAHPTAAPSDAPTQPPSLAPSYSPSIAPSLNPSIAPSISPSYSPSNAPSFSPTTAPTNAPSWSPTARVDSILKLQNTNMNLTCGAVYNKKTTKDKEFDYYILDLSQINSIPNMIVTTCCKSQPVDQMITMDMDGTEYLLTLNTTSYCDSSSLDTVLYLLKYDIRKELVSVLTQQDDHHDTKKGFCNDNGKAGKSTIDISSMINSLQESQDVIYYIAVGGYTERALQHGHNRETGRYQLELICEEYVYPLDALQILHNINGKNSKDIQCGNKYHNQANTDNELVSYYYFDITKKTKMPIIVSTCDYKNKYKNYTTYVHVASIQYYRKEASGFIIEKYETLDDENCAEFDGIDISSLDVGKYVIAVAGFNNNSFRTFEGGNFSISMSCGYPPQELNVVELVIIASVIFLVVLCCCVTFFVWYCRKLKEYKEKHKPQYAQLNSGTNSHQSISMVNIDDANKLSPKPHTLPRARTTTLRKTQSVRNDIIEKRSRMSIGGTEYKEIVGRHLEKGDLEDHPDMDRVIAVMRDIIKCCEDGGEGLDIYQVLAFRRLDPASNEAKLFEPLRHFGIHYQLLSFTHFHRALFVGFVVACLQVVGITVILYSVTYEWFTDDTAHSTCGWQAKVWKEAWPFKFLAFFWAIVITLSISTTLAGVKYSAFNNVMVIPAERFSELDIVDVGVIYVGYLINLYTLLLAVFGSYFLVYSSEGGSGAIDMVLNAVALFFIIELDDYLVSHRDAEDIQVAADEFLQKYEKTHNINHNNQDENKDERKRMEDMDDEEEHEPLQRSQSQWFEKEGLLKLSKIVKYLSLTIQFVAFTGGLIAPFAIFVCFSN